MNSSNKETGKKAPDLKVGHIVSHTHWDREWRYPIWETRLMLIDFMDELIECLEKGLYAGFLLDGQVSPVLDYLEIKPEMKDRIVSLVKSGKLEIGPWLTLPDEYPIDGECMVRNLLLGIRQAEKLGGVFMCAYTSFGWGQTAQLPQIYSGFGIDVAMVGKKVNPDRAPQNEFLWLGPDGSELITTRFGAWGRHNFMVDIHLSALMGKHYVDGDWQYKPTDKGVLYHRADTDQREQDFFILDKPDKWHPEWLTPEKVDQLWDTTKDSIIENDRLMMDGVDYGSPQKMLPEIVSRINEIDPQKGRKWKHTVMRQYADIMRKIDRSKLVKVFGELRDGPAGTVSGNALSTRLYVKKKNKLAENMLIHFAEPFSVLNAMLGQEYPDTLLSKAWQFLLNSHSHDSINGVTQDKTVRDVENRLDQVIDISQALGNKAMQQLIMNIDRSNFDEKDVLLVVFNPLPYPRREVIDAQVDISNGEKNFWPKAEYGLVAYDSDGKAVPTQWMGYSEKTYPVVQWHSRSFPYYCNSHRLLIDTGEMPAGGYKVFKVGSIAEMKDGNVDHKSSLVSTASLRVDPHTLENEHLTLSFNSNGTFDIYCKQLDHTFAGLNYFEDRGEFGDYWINKIPVNDQIHTSLGCNARIWTKEHGPLQAIVVTEVTMEIPKRGIASEQSRSGETEQLKIQTEVTLKKGSKSAEVQVSFENKCKDHYLRVMMPTGLANADRADSGGHFNVDSRPIKIQGPTSDCTWPDMATLPHQRFVDVSDKNMGFAVVNDCFTEYEVTDSRSRTIAISLLRAVKNWICTEARAGSNFPSQDGGQCLGKHRYRYMVCPHAGNWESANLPLQADLFNTPVRIVQTKKTEGTLPAGKASLFSIDNLDIRFSALKKAQDTTNFILRVYNPTDRIQSSVVRFCSEIKQAWQTNLNEERIDACKAEKKSIEVNLKPHEISTFEIMV